MFVFKIFTLCLLWHKKALTTADETEDNRSVQKYYRLWQRAVFTNDKTKRLMNHLRLNSEARHFFCYERYRLLEKETNKTKIKEYKQTKHHRNFVDSLDRRQIFPLFPLCNFRMQQQRARSRRKIDVRGKIHIDWRLQRSYSCSI